MSPILGIWASSQQPALNATSFDSIATATPSGTSSVTFSNIPQTYKHLQIRAFVGMVSGTPIALTINSGSYARRHYLYGDGSSAVAGSDTNNDIMSITNTTSTPSIYSANILDILDYTNTNKTKTYRVLGGSDTNGAGTAIMFSALDLSTTAINSITLSSSSNFGTYTKIALYGVK